MGQFSKKKRQKKKNEKEKTLMSGYIFYVIIVSTVAKCEIKISQLTYECFNNPFSDTAQVFENTYLMKLLQ